ncbi:aspartate kinase [Bacillus sp. HMF5848]|uniref:aspartate kinase n=1 Tax=Bacillus sp. HMF5848 TaxID=2495421 RepID=UPI000F7873F4|nr:aspartate kinase [Bacillus sp. HMF5848]RSK29251.1 aspartate kinase [Bacillus sp. HMF5848]
MKVVKFGGSSVASAGQFKKVASIVTSDVNRKFVVVSAPGKRSKDDIKMTDMLIGLAQSISTGEDYQTQLTQILDRYEEIALGLELPTTIIADIRAQLEKTISAYQNSPRLLDNLKASGEDNNARLMAHYLQHLGHRATYMNPKHAGILVSDEPGNAQVLPETYDNLSQLRNMEGIIVIPGFFGYTIGGELVTFPRGGSDITGSIVAAGVTADLYENFTDVDSIYCVNPNIVQNPQDIKELTYREMRELSYAGFSVFHDEALQPVYHAGIPVCVKNTNNPDAPGTLILSTREHSKQPVVGIASDKGFCTVYVSKYMMNREIGFGRKLLQILEDECISYEHTPSGIDNLSIILRSNQLNGEVESRVLDRIRTELEVDDISIEHNQAIIMVVGEGMTSTIGIASKATTAFMKANVNIDMINQGSSEVSMMFGVKECDLNNAVQALYNVYFN